MVTPLARRLKPLRQALAESANRFELNQVLRLFARAQRPVRIVVDPSGVNRTEDVVAVRLGRGQQPAEVEVASSCVPSAVRAEGAEAVEEYVRARYSAWLAAQPAFVAEAVPQAMATLFVRRLLAVAGGDVTEVAPEFAAFAAGAIRRGSAAELEAVCSEYFGVPVRLEVASARTARLRVGPLTFAEYREFHPHLEGSALDALLALASAFLSPNAPPDVLLILHADEVPACVTDADGATVGFSCWPHDGNGRRREDVEFLIRNDAMKP